MTGREREALRAAIDAKQREILQPDTSDCGGSVSRYRKGCRCVSCLRATADARKRRRQAVKARQAA